MAITKTASGTTFTGRASIETFRLIALRSRLGLELKGLKFRGRTSYSILKQELGLTGTRESVYAQVGALLDTMRANPGAVQGEQ